MKSLYSNSHFIILGKSFGNISELRTRENMRWLAFWVKGCDIGIGLSYWPIIQRTCNWIGVRDKTFEEQEQIFYDIPHVRAVPYSLTIRRLYARHWARLSWTFDTNKFSGVHFLRVSIRFYSRILWKSFETVHSRMFGFNGVHSTLIDTLDKMIIDNQFK